MLNYLNSGVNDYLALKKMVPENDINEVLQLAVVLAQYGFTKDNVESLVRWSNGTERIRAARDLRRIADGLVADL